MRHRSAMALLLVLGASVAVPFAVATDMPLPLRHVADVELPGPPNRFDYQSYDAARHRLFIAHLGAGKVVAFDTQTNHVVGEVAGIRDVHGVLVAGSNVYASATGTNEIVAIDPETLRIVARSPTGVYPDGIAYAPHARKLYVSDQTGATETVIDASTNQRVKTIRLDGEAGNTQYDAVSKHVFVNVQTRNELVEIDPQTDAIVARHPLAGADHNHGLLIDAGARVAYVACEGNARLLVFDLDSKRVTSTYAVGADPDVLAFDEGLRLLYVASESGVVSLFRREGKELTKLGESLLAKHAHSVAVAPDTHRVYFPLESVGGRAVLRIMEPSTR